MIEVAGEQLKKIFGSNLNQLLLRSPLWNHTSNSRFKRNKKLRAAWKNCFDFGNLLDTCFDELLTTWILRMRWKLLCCWNIDHISLLLLYPSISILLNKLIQYTTSLLNLSNLLLMAGLQLLWIPDVWWYKMPMIQQNNVQCSVKFSLRVSDIQICFSNWMWIENVSETHSQNEMILHSKPKAYSISWKQ